MTGHPETCAHSDVAAHEELIETGSVDHPYQPLNPADTRLAEMDPGSLGEGLAFWAQVIRGQRTSSKVEQIRQDNGEQ